MLKANMTMPQFADLLTNLLHAGDTRGQTLSDMHEYQGGWQEVVDRTGLTETYQVAVASSLPSGLVGNRVVAEPMRVTITEGIRPDFSPSLPNDVLDPTVFSSVQKLGLKLELSKAPIELLIVDHADKTPVKR